MACSRANFFYLYLTAATPTWHRWMTHERTRSNIHVRLFTFECGRIFFNTEEMLFLPSRRDRGQGGRAQYRRGSGHRQVRSALRKVLDFTTNDVVIAHS